MKEWTRGVTSDEPTCQLPANARRMSAAGLASGGSVRLSYGRCEDLDCGGSVSVRVSAASGHRAAVGVWHDGKWFGGGIGGQLGLGYRDVMTSLKQAATPTLDIEPRAA
jgi:hypothetical protein